MLGAYYCGYAALWPVSRNPGGYRCAAGFAGVTNWKSSSIGSWVNETCFPELVTGSGLAANGHPHPLARSLHGHDARRRTKIGMSQYDPGAHGRPAWNSGRKVGAKRALKPRQIWAIRFFLDREGRVRDRALFDLAIDSKLRGCDLVKIKIGDLVAGPEIRTRAIVVQQKTGRPVQFELMTDVRASLLAWLNRRGGAVTDYAFPSRVDQTAHLSTRQYARLVDEWVTAAGLRKEDYGTHSLRRTKASIIYKATGNLRAVQILLGIVDKG